MHACMHISDKLDEIVKREGVSQKEALERLVTGEWKAFEEADETRKKRAKARGLPITKEDYEEKRRNKH